MPAQPLSPAQKADAARLSSLYDEWKASRKAQGLPASQEVAASLLGFSTQSAVSQYVRGSIPLNVRALIKFSELFECPASDISPELAKEIKQIAAAAAPAKGSSGQAGEHREVDLDDSPDTVRVRKVIFKISAGIAGFAVDYLDNGEGTPLYFPKAWADKKNLAPEKLYATRVSGSSMFPTILPSDVIIVNTGDTKRAKDAVCAINHEGEFTVKRLRYEMRRWWLVSDNPDQRSYPPTACTDGTYILGRVVHLHRDL